MKVWVHDDGSHYHLIESCEAIRNYPNEQYVQMEWVRATYKGYIPCPICHDKNLEIREVRKVVK